MAVLLTKASNLIKKILNGIFFYSVGGSHRPVFFDIGDTCPELLEIDKNYGIIREELENILVSSGEIPRYHEIDSKQTRISGSDEKNWRVFMLYAVGEKPEENQHLCPQTCELLSTIPNLFHAVFSILEPGKAVPAHNGPYLGYLRYHLGLIVPAERPPSIRVKDQIYTWKEGESVLFDDFWDHEVYNECKETRVVLMVDVLRPMPPPLNWLNYLYSFFLLRHVYGKAAVRNLKTLRQLS